MNKLLGFIISIFFVANVTQMHADEMERFFSFHLSHIAHGMTEEQINDANVLACVGNLAPYISAGGIAACALTDYSIAGGVAAVAPLVCYAGLHAYYKNKFSAEEFKRIFKLSANLQAIGHLMILTPFVALGLAALPAYVTAQIGLMLGVAKKYVGLFSFMSLAAARAAVGASYDQSQRSDDGSEKQSKGWKDKLATFTRHFFMRGYNEHQVNSCAMMLFGSAMLAHRIINGPVR